MYPHLIAQMVGLLTDTKVLAPEQKDQATAALTKFWSDKTALVWTRDDVLYECPNLTDEEADRVLAMVLHTHDANLGVNWEKLRSVALRLGFEPGDPLDEDEPDEPKTDIP